MKKFLSILLSILFSTNSLVFANDSVLTSMTKTSQQDFKQKTVAKRYNVYDISITNNNKQALMLTTDTEVLFTLDDGTVVTSENRRAQYRKVRKRDIGRYYWFAMPGAIIAGGITGITFFIGAPIGFAIYVGMYAPTDKAVRTNVKISQCMFNENVVPIRMEAGTTYNARIFIPKKLKIKNVIISNVSYDLDNKFDLVMNAEDL